MRPTAGRGVCGGIAIMVTVAVRGLFTMTILRKKKQGKLSILSMVGVNPKTRRYETEERQEAQSYSCAYEA